MNVALAQVFSFARGDAGDLCEGLVQVFRLAGVGGGWVFGFEFLSDSCVAERILDHIDFSI